MRLLFTILYYCLIEVLERVFRRFSRAESYKADCRPWRYTRYTTPLVYRQKNLPGATSEDVLRTSRQTLPRHIRGTCVASRTMLVCTTCRQDSGTNDGTEPCYSCGSIMWLIGSCGCLIIPESVVNCGTKKGDLLCDEITIRNHYCSLHGARAHRPAS